jgi:hypothetical protein
MRARSTGKVYSHNWCHSRRKEKIAVCMHSILQALRSLQFLVLYPMHAVFSPLKLFCANLAVALQAKKLPEKHERD